MFLLRAPVALAVLCAVLLSGCASILATTENTVVIDSSPAGATVWLNGRELGPAPYTYVYDKADGMDLPFEVRKPGYVSATTTVKVRRNNGILFADAMLFHIPYPFDKDHPNLYRIPKSALMVDLTKELTKDLEKIQVPVTGLDLLTGERVAAGTFNKARITTGNTEVFNVLRYPEDLANSAVQGFRETWVDARIVRRGTTKGDETLQRTKLFLRPALMSVMADLTGGRDKSEGTMTVDVDWRFYGFSAPDSVLLSIRSTTVYTSGGERTNDLVGLAISKGAHRLLEDDSLHARLMRMKKVGLEHSKGTLLELPAPKPIAFTGRKDMLSELLKAVATVETSDGHGSGFLITNTGYILTNEHVVENDKSVKVRFSQGFTLDAEVVKINKDFDLALLKAQVDDMPALTIGVDSSLLVGEEIFAIGTPLDKELGQTVSRGILSGKREFEGRHYLQTDVSINPGNSGGPLIDETGKVVGVATLKISGRGLEGLGFGVPISKALEMLNITLKP